MHGHPAAGPKPHAAIARGARRGFGLPDLCVAIGILVLGVGILSALMDQARRSSSRIPCASNLRQIAMAAIIYSMSSGPRGAAPFPRVTYDPATANAPTAYTGVNAADPFGPGGPRANDVTAVAFMLMKAGDLTPDVFVCPDGGEATAWAVDPKTKSNFPGRQHLAYSFVNPYPYPSSAAVAAGWRFDTSLPPDYPLASDMNPGACPEGSPAALPYTADRQHTRAGNSPNHRFDGQQVAYVDAHVEWNNTPFCGAPRPGAPYRDNLFATRAGADPATGAGGGLAGSPVDTEDAVLLPTYADAAPGTARPPGRPRVPSDPPQPVPLPLWVRAGWAATVLGVVLLVGGLIRILARPGGQDAQAVAGG